MLIKRLVLSMIVGMLGSLRTHQVRIAGSSQANPFACIAAGIASLWGKLQFYLSRLPRVKRHEFNRLPNSTRAMMAMSSGSRKPRLTTNEHQRLSPLFSKSRCRLVYCRMRTARAGFVGHSDESSDWQGATPKSTCKTMVIAPVLRDVHKCAKYA